MYRLPTFLIFTSLTYVFMSVVGFTKLKTSKQLAIIAATMYIADTFIQRRKASDIFYSLPPLDSKELERKRKDLINKSVILDGQIYILDKDKSS